jgi:hypothetical protein
MYVSGVICTFLCLCFINALNAKVIPLMCFFRRIIYSWILKLSYNPCCHRCDGNSLKSMIFIIYLHFLVFWSTTSCLDWYQCVLHLLNSAGTLNLFCSHHCHCRSLLVQLTVKISWGFSEGPQLLPTCIFIPKSDVGCGKSTFYHWCWCCNTVGYSKGE